MIVTTVTPRDVRVLRHEMTCIIRRSAECRCYLPCARAHPCHVWQDGMGWDTVGEWTKAVQEQRESLRLVEVQSRRRRGRLSNWCQLCPPCAQTARKDAENRCTSTEDVASKPEVGSSRNSNVGSATNSIPIFTRFNCTPKGCIAMVAHSRS